MGMAIVLWDNDPEDWKVKDTDEVIKRVVKFSHRGGIILSHDVWPTTRAAYGQIIDQLKAKGFEFVTVPELFGPKLKPGVPVRQFRGRVARMMS
jgi:peptidoglycan/xylan/chitin deacetylase (PgdA/CDA1 family)